MLSRVHTHNSVRDIQYAQSDTHNTRSIIRVARIQQVKDAICLYAKDFAVRRLQRNALGDTPTHHQTSIQVRTFSQHIQHICMKYIYSTSLHQQPPRLRVILKALGRSWELHSSACAMSPRAVVFVSICPFIVCTHTHLVLCRRMSSNMCPCVGWVCTHPGVRRSHAVSCGAMLLQVFVYRSIHIQYAHTVRIYICCDDRAVDRAHRTTATSHKGNSGRWGNG